MNAQLRKLRRILTPAQRRSALALLGLMIVGITLEILSTGMVIPAIALLVQQDLAATYPHLKPLFALLGNLGPTKLILQVMLGLVSIYVAKNLFLAFLAWCQARFAYGVQAQLSQYLADDTLRRNVAFGLPDCESDEAAVKPAIRAAQLEEFVARLSKGLDTMVGDRGIRPSGGQRQRIGIARALNHDPAVLVLDQTMSALDTATKRGVMQAVNALHGSKALLIVAHRLSTVAGCDRLYRLEQGRGVAETVPGTEPVTAGTVR